jgi:hypothetical protein
MITALKFRKASSDDVLVFGRENGYIVIIGNDTGKVTGII